MFEIGFYAYVLTVVTFYIYCFCETHQTLNYLQYESATNLIRLVENMMSYMVCCLFFFNIFYNFTFRRNMKKLIEKINNIKNHSFDFHKERTNILKQIILFFIIVITLLSISAILLLHSLKNINFSIQFTYFYPLLTFIASIYEIFLTVRYLKQCLQSANQDITNLILCKTNMKTKLAYLVKLVNDHGELKELFEQKCSLISLPFLGFCVYATCNYTNCAFYNSATMINIFQGKNYNMKIFLSGYVIIYTLISQIVLVLYSFLSAEKEVRVLKSHNVSI